MPMRRAIAFLKSCLADSGRLAADRAVPAAAGVRRRFLLSERGAVAIYFGFSAIVFIGVAGLAVDAARGYLVKARLSEAIDAAALAGGKALQIAANNTVVNADTLNFFNANFPTGAMGATVAVPTIVIGNNATTVTVNSTATIPTTLMSVLGFRNMTIGASGQAARAQSGLDVVFSFDISGSMCQPCTKIQALQSNAKALVDSLNQPFTSGIQQQMVTINGTTYSMLNIGVVPWSSKVNVLTYPATTPGAISSTNLTFADPMGRFSPPNLTKVYHAANSEVPLLYNPSTIASGWTGCVYARYNDKSSNEQDDITLGTNATWPGWEPIPKDEGEPQGGRNQNCDSSFWNNNQPSSDGSQIPKLNGVVVWPVPAPGLRHNEECAACPQVGILPLQNNATTVKNMIDQLQSDGATDSPQGLFWAWEVLMPGDPFNEAIVAPPFQRAQAIVLMTDGQNYGSNGDAYHGWYGETESAATVSSKGNMTMPDGTSVNNNLDDRFLSLAAKIKGANPLDPNAVRIYVIQYEENNPALTTLLSSAATQPGAPYYFFAPDEASLGSIFAQIGASLSALRLTQ